MSLKTWLLNKLVKYATKEAGKKKMQEMRSRFLNTERDTTLPEVSFVWEVNKEGECTCPYHIKKEKKKRKVSTRVTAGQTVGVVQANSKKTRRK